MAGVGRRGSELRHSAGWSSFVPLRCAVPASHRLDGSMATWRPWASLAVWHGHQSEAAPPLYFAHGMLSRRLAA
jgi:hypothetical protein